MMDTTIKKVDSAHSPRGRAGETHLASGKAVAMRHWAEAAGEGKPHSRPYETVGYVIAGRAEVVSEGQLIKLAPGDSWVIPSHARHYYRILESFQAVEATSPPAHVFRSGERPG